MKSHDAKIPFYAARASNENWFSVQFGFVKVLQMDLLFYTNGVLTNGDLEFYDNDSSRDK